MAISKNKLNKRPVVMPTTNISNRTIIPETIKAPTKMVTSELGKQLIKGYEKCKLIAYDDAHPDKILKKGDKVNGTLTIGWGSTTMPNGSKIKIGDEITKHEADVMFDKNLPSYEARVRNLIKRDPLNPLLQREFDAAVSFCYNAGTGYVDGGKVKQYNLWKHISEAKKPQEMYLYWTTLAVTSNGVKMDGLIRRRRSEVTMYQSGVLNFFQ